MCNLTIELRSKRMSSVYCDKCGIGAECVCAQKKKEGSVVASNGVLCPDAEHIKKVRKKIKKWEIIFKTNKNGMGEKAEGHIKFLKKELLRIGA
jgi:hypothetical protein